MMELVASDLNKFDEAGIISLKGLVPKNQCNAIKRSILAEFDRLKLKEKSKRASSKNQALPFFQQISSLSQKIKLGPELDGIFATEFIVNLSLLTHAKLIPAAPQPHLLVSLPHTESWSVTHLNWHVDLTVPALDEIPGVQAFVLIDDVLPKGGATLAIAGSHKLPYLIEHRGRSAHAVLREHPLFSGLYSGASTQAELFFQPHKLNGVDIYIVEMCGRAGDVFLMDMRVLHSPSINATKNIRMMATQRFLRQPS